MEPHSSPEEVVAALAPLIQLAATLIGRPILLHVLSPQEEALIRQAHGEPLPGQEPLFSQADGWPWL